MNLFVRIFATLFFYAAQLIATAVCFLLTYSMYRFWGTLIFGQFNEENISPYEVVGGATTFVLFGLMFVFTVAGFPEWVKDNAFKVSEITNKFKKNKPSVF